MKKIILFICILTLQVHVYSQEKFEYFYKDTTSGCMDNIKQVIKVADGIILVGTINFKNYYYIPTIKKIDLYGNIKWVQIFNNYELTYVDCIYATLLDDGFLYVVIDNQLTYQNRDKPFFKIDILSGNIIYNEILNTYRTSIIHFVDYNDTIICKVYFDETYKRFFELVNRETFEVYQSRIDYANVSNGDGTHTTFIVDNEKDIIIAQGANLMKLKGDEIDSVKWSNNFNSALFPSGTIDKIYQDEYNNLYIFGRGSIAKINSITGSLIWEKRLTYSSSYKNFIDYNGYIYLSLFHNTSGGGTYATCTGKIDKNTGTTVWYDPDYIFGNTSAQGALSIDIDSENNLYQTGVYNETSGTTGGWFVFKKDVDGNILFTKEISRDTTIKNYNSVGKYIEYKNDSLFVIGLSQNYYGDRDPFTYILNKNTGDILYSKMIRTDPLEESETSEIVKFGENILIAKELGTEILLECYSNSKTKIWSNMIVNRYVSLNFRQLKIINDKIYLTVYSGDYGFKVYILNNQGVIEGIHEEGVNVWEHDAFIDLEVINDYVYIIFESYNDLYYSYINSLYSDNSTSFEVRVDRNNNTRKSYNAVYINTQGELKYFGENKIFTIKDDSFTSKNYSYCNLYINDVIVDDTIAYLGGSNEYNQHFVSSYDINNNRFIWEKSKTLDGEVSHLLNYNDNSLLAIATHKDSLFIYTLSKFNGDTLQFFKSEILGYDSIHVTDVLINDSIYISGYTLDDTTTHGFYTSIDKKFLINNTTYFYDELSKQSKVNCLEVDKNNKLWIGGSYNTIDEGLRGFYFTYNEILNSVSTNIPSDTVSINLPRHIYSYPNPCTNYLKINTNEFNQYAIFNNVGQQIIKGYLQNEIINTQVLPEGWYYLLLTNNQTFKGLSFYKK